MQLILIALVWSGIVACSGITVKAHGSDIVERGPSVSVEKRNEVPEYCTSGKTDPPADCECYEDGKFNEKLGHDTLDCGNL